MNHTQRGWTVGRGEDESAGNAAISSAPPLHPGGGALQQGADVLLNNAAVVAETLHGWYAKDHGGDGTCWGDGRFRPWTGSLKCLWANAINKSHEVMKMLNMMMSMAVQNTPLPGWYGHRSNWSKLSVWIHGISPPVKLLNKQTVSKPNGATNTQTCTETGSSAKVEMIIEQEATIPIWNG